MSEGGCRASRFAGLQEVGDARCRSRMSYTETLTALVVRPDHQVIRPAGGVI